MVLKLNKPYLVDVESPFFRWATDTKRISFLGKAGEAGAYKRLLPNMLDDTINHLTIPRV